jgi:signal peptidase I
MVTSEQRTSQRPLLVRIAIPLVVALVVVSVLKAFVLEAYRIPSESMEKTLMPGDFVLVNKLAFGLRTPSEVPILGMPLPVLTLVPGRDIRRGDVVVFAFHDSPRENSLPRGSKLVKRVVGLPGDTVLITASGITINGQLLQIPAEAGQPPQGRESGLPRWLGPIVVPKKGQRVELSGDRRAEWAELIRNEGHDVSVRTDGKILIDGESRETYTVQNDYYYMLGDNLRNSYDSRFWGFVADRDMIGEVFVIYWSWYQGSSETKLATISSIRWDRIGSLVR